ncbi:MAG: hypothetical protein IKB70_06155 [Bacilli bacterium]|nr:hypothetical protein [Bacilli bacterium]
MIYVPFEAGIHNITVTVYPLNDEFQPASASITIECATSMMTAPFSEGVFTFSESEVAALGFNAAQLTKTNGGNYELYYSKDGWTSVRSEKMSYTNTSVSSRLQALRSAGVNVLVLSNGPFAEPVGFYWETSPLKKIMDEAWFGYGIKCVVYDATIVGVDGSQEYINSVVAERLSNVNVKSYFSHPGFMGLMVDDEPTYSKLDVVGYKYNAIQNEAKAQLGVDKVFVSSILKFWGSDVLFDYNSYADYIQKWFDLTDADYVVVDNYSPYILEVCTQDTLIKTFNTVNAIAKKEGAKVYSYTTAFDFSGIDGVNGVVGKDLTASAFYQNAYLTIAYGNDLSYFTGTPSSAENTISNTFFDFDGNVTTTKNLVANANQIYAEICRLLKGYTYSSDSISTKDLVSTTWTNGNSTAKFYVNTSVNSATRSITISSGTNYLLLGIDGSITNCVGQGSRVSLSVGQAVLIFN